ncbi:DUF1894 domain-containing protein [Methanocella arvoryzae]|uniref:Uncharacterized protein n=1 Tax=Methanocella arvoryzae (strain DSM 22066 / NBRC 105507 / MRE50) TaxID=351160 RepID=Q0W329_METAR|nr:DUF1894 domain-containing protein [Methanocella arvoryzae]CAJ37214.1 hypothetical protein RCIX2074 [Methanocella arvoryzae MRE50]
MACLNDYNYEILLSHCTLRQGEEFIRSKYWETYYFEPGFQVLGLRTLGEGAIPVAIEDNTDDTIIFTYTKPCMGTFVLRIPGVPDEVKRVRTGYTKSLTLDRWTGSSGKTARAEAITCPLDVSLRNFNYDILSHFKTFRECEKFIRSKYWETYYFPPEFRVLGLRPLGKDYIPVAIDDKDENNLIFPFHDSTMGPLVIRINGVPSEVKRVRENYSKDLTLKKWKETS